MRNFLNISDLTKLVGSHAKQLSLAKHASSYDSSLKAEVLSVLQQVEARAAGRPEIQAVVLSVRKALQDGSECQL